MATNFEMVKEAIEQSNLIPHKKSGRGMDGKECLGFRTTNLPAAMATITETLIRNKYPGDVVSLFEHAQIINLRRLNIVYFPSLPWEDPSPGEAKTNPPLAATRNRKNR
jgi:hypothetical protein